VAGRRQFSRQVSRRAPTSWAGFSGLFTIPNAGKILVGTFTPVPNFAHETLVRMVGMWRPEVTAYDGVYAIGAAVVSDAAVTAGVASMPDPITEIQDDLWTFISGGANNTAATFNEGLVFDSRGMRKLEDGQAIAVIAAGTSPLVPIDAGIYVRALFKQAVRG